MGVLFRKEWNLSAQDRWEALKFWLRLGWSRQWDTTC